MAHRTSSLPYAALTAGILLVSCAVAQPESSNSTLSQECKAAIAAQQLVLNTRAVLGNKSVPFGEDDSLIPSADFRGRVLNILRAAPTQTNLIKMFQGGTPYDSWGNMVIQVVLSQAVHVPSAVLGEVAYAAALTTQKWQAARAEAVAANTTVPQNETFAFWTDSWLELVDSLQEGAKDMSDSISKRAMLLRSMNYAYAAYYPQPTHPDYLDAYLQGKRNFREAMDMFEAYSTTFFKVPFSNGTTDIELDAFLVTPSPNQAAPTIVILGSVFNWKEVQFMRYGLAALRRGYAVLFLDQPGQGLAIRQPPYMTAVADTGKVVEAVLEAVGKDEEGLAQQVDKDQVVLLGITLGSYGAARACAELTSSSLAACILNPGMYSLGDLALDVVAKRGYTVFSTIASEDSTVFASADVAQALMDPKERVLKTLLYNCSSEPMAQQLLAATLQGSVTDPELFYLSISTLGMLNATNDELASNYFNALARLYEDFSTFDMSGWRGPTLVLGGAEDTATGGQEQKLKEMVEEQSGGRAEVDVIIFGAETGAALNAQIGAVTYWELEVFPWLKEKLSSTREDSVTSSSSNNNSTAGRR